MVSVLTFKSKGPGFKSQSIQVVFFCFFLVWKGKGSNPGHFFKKKINLYHNFIPIYEFSTLFWTYSNRNLNGCIKVKRKSKFEQGASGLLKITKKKPKPPQRQVVHLKGPYILSRLVTVQL